MKHFLLLAMLLLPAMSWGKSKEVVWKELEHGVSNATSLDFHSVEFTDSFTIVDFDIKDKNCRLQKKTKLITDNGTELKFKRLDGGLIGKLLKEPGRYRMYFEPAPKGCKWLHFYEGNADNDWRINYIRDKKTKIKLQVPVEWKNVKYDSNEPLPVASYKVDTATVTFQLMGYYPWMQTSIAYYGNLFGEQDGLRSSIQADSTGMAVLKLPLSVLTKIKFNTGSGYYYNLVVAPGDKITYLIDMTKSNQELAAVQEFVAVKGNHATLNDEMVDEEYNRLYTQIKEFEPFAKVADCETEEERVKALNDGWETARQLIAKSKLSNVTKAMLRLETEETYWTIVKGYPIFLQEVRGIEFKSSDEYKKFWMKYRQTFGDSIRRVLATSQPFELATSASAPMVGRDFYNDISTFIFAKASDVLPYSRDLYYANYCLTQGIFKDYYVSQVKDSTLSEAIKQGCAQLKAFEAALKQDDAVYYQKLDSIAPDKILQHIIDMYKGQAFLIDMWATWCGPCRQGHKSMAPLKEELKNEPVKFVYITDSTSPAGTWKKMIDEIPGDHFYLTREQEQAIMKVFDSTGIPTYAIYDAEGHQTYKHIGFPGNAEMKKQLLKAMGKE